MNIQLALDRFKGQRTNDVVYNLKHRNIITGRNGSGKSAMVEALQFLLLGKAIPSNPLVAKTAKDIGAKLAPANVVTNLGHDTHPSASALFTVNEGKVLRIDRSLNEDGESEVQINGEGAKYQTAASAINSFFGNVAVESVASVSSIIKASETERISFLCDLLDIEDQTTMARENLKVAKRKPDNLLVSIQTVSDIMPSAPPTSECMEAWKEACAVVKALVPDLSTEEERKAAKAAREAAFEVKEKARRRDFLMETLELFKKDHAEASVAQANAKKTLDEAIEIERKAILATWEATGMGDKLGCELDDELRFVWPGGVLLPSGGELVLRMARIAKEKLERTKAGFKLLVVEAAECDPMMLSALCAECYGFSGMVIVLTHFDAHQLHWTGIRESWQQLVAVQVK